MMLFLKYGESICNCPQKLRRLEEDEEDYQFYQQEMDIEKKTYHNLAISKSAEKVVKSVFGNETAVSFLIVFEKEGKYG